MITRYILLATALLFIIFQYVDAGLLRPITAEKKAQAIYVKDATMSPLVVENQEVVNNESVEKLVEDGIVEIFNFRPGQADIHIQSQNVKDFFISKEYHEEFAVQFLHWARYEFSVNNISIKEAIAKNGRLIKTPSSMASGVRLWRYRAELPTLDRGVGGNDLSTLSITVDMVYLGASGGMGAYAVTLSM